MLIRLDVRLAGVLLAPFVGSIDRASMETDAFEDAAAPYCGVAGRTRELNDAEAIGLARESTHTCVRIRPRTTLTTSLRVEAIHPPTRRPAREAGRARSIVANPDDRLGVTTTPVIVVVKTPPGPSSTSGIMPVSLHSGTWRPARQALLPASPAWGCTVRGAPAGLCSP
ncbi:MAG: hypothetical protein SFZ23_03575 [Planctomycetota bacterium]|nr:hypothetical protein [Planctomycetota bacterium]